MLTGERQCRAAWKTDPSVRCEGINTELTVHAGRHRGFNPAGQFVHWDNSESVLWQEPPVKCEARYTTPSGSVECHKAAGHGNAHRAADPDGGSDYFWSRDSARDTQVGGDHYRKFRIQVWDIWQEYGLDAFTGTVVKYLLRAGHKGDRLEDLKKARQTLDRLIEIEETKV